MKLYLLRHGIATERMDNGAQDDSQRPLTKKGREHMESIAAALKKLKVKPDLILSSPYVRADQTAQIVAKEFGMKKKLQYSDLLVPEADPQAILQAIPQQYNVEELMLVGHNPHMGELLGALLGADVSAALGLKKGGLACFTVTDPSAHPSASLEWLLTPGLLLKMG
jgi:phosphohistidine phosphatase